MYLFLCFLASLFSLFFLILSLSLQLESALIAAEHEIRQRTKAAETGWSTMAIADLQVSNKSENYKSYTCVLSIGSFLLFTLYNVLCFYMYSVHICEHTVFLFLVLITCTCMFVHVKYMYTCRRSYSATDIEDIKSIGQTFFHYKQISLYSIYTLY